MRQPPRDRLHTALDAGSVFVNRLVWIASLEEENGPLTVSPFEVSALPPDEYLPRSHYESIHRSVRELVRRRVVRHVARRPTGRELLQLYPYQTKSSRVAFLRAQLMPALFGSAGEDPGEEHDLRHDGARYTRAQNELFAMEKLSLDDRQRLRGRWDAIADRVLQIEAALSPDERYAVFALRVKCMELCSPGEVSHSQTFQRLLRRLEKREPSPLVTEVVALMRSFYELLPLAEINQARLKTALYGYVDFRTRRTPRLTEHAKDSLRRAAPHIVEKLPIFRENMKKKRLRQEQGGVIRYGMEAFLARNEPDAFYDPLLDKLLGRDLFRKFQFIEYAA